MKTFKGLIFISFVSIFCATCTPSGSVEKPERFIPKEQFMEILIDLHLTDAMLNDKKLDDNQLDSGSYYNFLLQKYDISKKTFEENLYYYSNQPQVFNAVYDSVLTRLSKKLEHQQIEKPDEESK